MDKKMEMLGTAHVIMTSLAGKVKIYLAGTGTATINWGDGSKSETHNLIFNNFDIFCGKNSFIHTYSDASAHTITINGNITDLTVELNHLTALDVSQNTALIKLDCLGNQLTELNLSKNSALKDLRCDNNQLTELDLSQNSVLIDLDCSDNQLTALDISKNTALKSLRCYDNQLTALDLSRNTALKWLFCGNNSLTALDVSHNIALESLSCGDNQLTALDLSQNNVFDWLYCANNRFTANALNAMFETLHSDADSSFIYRNPEAADCYPVPLYELHVYENPETDDCNTSIAEKKGWKVIKGWKNE